MRLSQLQRYILRQGIESRNYRILKKNLEKFYLLVKKKKPKKEDQIDIITKSIDKMIKNNLIKGLGVKTAEKWFIKEIILTQEGIRRARELLGQQQKLPFKIKKSRRKVGIKDNK